MKGECLCDTLHEILKRCDQNIYKISVKFFIISKLRNKVACHFEAFVTRAP